MSTMQTPPRTARSSVLGKRGQLHVDSLSSSSSSTADTDDASTEAKLLTPDSSPCAKRARTSLTLLDGEGNKENVAPLRCDAVVDSPGGGRVTRALRRTSTELTTPTRSRQTPRRRASTSSLQIPNTPSTAMSHLALQTPPRTPSLQLPLHARARALLRATCNSNANIAGRSAERDMIRNFATAFFAATPKPEDLVNPVLYISGSPGCGKTALVTAVLNDLEVEMFEHGVNIILINCMAFNSLESVWERLLQELGGSLPRGKKSRDCVENILARRNSKCILVLDEMDHVATSSHALISLFSLAEDHPSTLRIIGIANTHTLTSSASQLSMHGVTGVKTVHFAAYQPAQLLQIIQARLQPLAEQDLAITEDVVRKFLPLPSLTLLSKKIASQTGDVRAIFEVLRGAIDQAVVEASVSARVADYVAPTVTPSHILSALKAYAPSSKVGSVPAISGSFTKTSSNSEVVMKVRNLGLQARLALLALLLACKRMEAALTLSGPNTSPYRTPPRSPTKRSNSSNNLSSSTSPTPRPGSSCIDTTHLHSFYSAILTRGEADVFKPVSRSEFCDLAGMLETVGLVSLSSSSGPSSPTKGRKLARSPSFGGGSKGLKGQDIKFVEGVRADEVLRGLGIEVGTQSTSMPVDVKEEEISALWHREMSKIKKESSVQRSKNTAISVSPAFDGSMED